MATTLRLLAVLLFSTALASPVTGSRFFPNAQKMPTPSFKDMQDVPSHPLDPLTASEFAAARNILIEAGIVVLGVPNLHTLELQPPPKAVVRGWAPGSPLPPRMAYAVTHGAPGEIHKLVVDITNNKLLSDTLHALSGIPMRSREEFANFTNILKDYQPLLKAVAKRGLSMHDIACGPDDPGWWGKEWEDGKRLARLACYKTKGTPNYHMQPVEGIDAVVDIGAGKVLEFQDSGVVPMGPKGLTDYRMADLQPPFLENLLKPISLEQPLGVSFKVSGHVIEWAQWKFHVRSCPRSGMVISNLTYTAQGEAPRDVMYEGAVSELWVPYMDPKNGWFFRTYLDAGEYGMGLNAQSLEKLNDCPRNAVYMDAMFSDSYGNPYVVPNFMCFFERYAGDTAWRHTDEYEEKITREVRPKVTLVARFASTVGNYDYTFDWEFQADGIVKAAVAMSGMINVKSVAEKTLPEALAANKAALSEGFDGLYGTYVSENTVGVVHDHFINYRMDLDIDGPANSFVESKMVKQRLPESELRKTVYQIHKKVVKKESEGRFNFSHGRPSEFHTVNPSVTTRLGNPTGYKLIPQATAATLMDPDDTTEMRAAFVQNQLWVTKYAESEKWAAGLFPTQSHGDDTLLTYSSQDRAIENEDIVMWYNIGFHHVPQQEDFPVMPSVVAGFELRPSNFFEKNPLLKAVPFRTADMPLCKSPGNIKSA